ncbi:jg14470 [Pararge aegeria aegeria]|uniref:Jg14470 protein n=1 Tax=Pararge aegeria aegeria TaxID=348720 RepID=A0A8S4RVY9_9NEOP|nr:jg14470 [Pararge aegeria aegeria]
MLSKSALNDDNERDIGAMLRATVLQEGTTNNLFFVDEAIKISLASTLKENIVWKPACPRVLHNVLKKCVVYTKPHWAILVDYGLFSLWEEAMSCSWPVKG